VNTSQSPIISVRDVYKSYGIKNAQTPVLRGVSLDVQPGEIVALLGQSGSGKSTLLNIIGSLDTWNKGEVQVMGVNYAKAKEQRLAALRGQDIGFVFQSFHLLEHLSCIENVVLPSSFSDMSTSDAHKAAMEAFDRVGIADFAHKAPQELSGGQKQRVAIARALFNRPSLLLCDEPTGNLDSETGESVIRFFEDLNKKDGVTLLIVTHEERLARCAKRVISIHDGRIQNDTKHEDSPSKDEPALIEGAKQGKETNA